MHIFKIVIGHRDVSYTNLPLIGLNNEKPGMFQEPINILLLLEFYCFYFNTIYYTNTTMK